MLIYEYFFKDKAYVKFYVVRIYDKIEIFLTG